MSKVKLLGAWASSYVWRVQVALNLKSVDYEFVEDLVMGKSELLIKCNPVYKKIPVLIHDHKPICESMIIVQYIDEVWTNSGPCILPSDPYDRALARFWAAYIDDKWLPDLDSTVKGESDVARRAAVEKVGENFGVLEKVFIECSKGKRFFGGDQIGYIDIALGCYIKWVKASEIMNGLIMLDEEKLPNLFSWAERFCSHDAVKSIMPEVEDLVELAYKVLVPSPR